MNDLGVTLHFVSKWKTSSKVDFRKKKITSIVRSDNEEESNLINPKYGLYSTT
jgi:hypothetical protein